MYKMNKAHLRGEVALLACPPAPVVVVTLLLILRAGRRGDGGGKGKIGDGGIKRRREREMSSVHNKLGANKN